MKRLYALLFIFLFILSACTKAELNAPLLEESDVKSTALETSTKALKETQEAKESNKNTFSPVCGALAQRVFYKNKIYYICGEGENEVLKSCGIAMPLNENSKGSFITYLECDENEKYIPCKYKTDALMYSYALKETENIYIIEFSDTQRYYAAVLHDENGYHGLG